MSDIMGILAPKGDRIEQFTATATFYAARPLSPLEGGQKIAFRYVNPRSAEHVTEVAYVEGQEELVTIRTPNKANYEPEHSYIVTQDGAMWVIVQMNTDYQRAPQQALRLFAAPNGTVYELRLRKIDNAWGIR